jgi:hypothetical protein
MQSAKRVRFIGFPHLMGSNGATSQGELAQSPVLRLYLVVGRNLAGTVGALLKILLASE